MRVNRQHVGDTIDYDQCKTGKDHANLNNQFYSSACSWQFQVIVLNKQRR